MKTFILTSDFMRVNTIKPLRGIVTCVLVFALIQTGCCKDDDDLSPATNHSIHGLWSGSSVSGTTTVPFFLSIKPNGTCFTEGIAPGTQENLGFGTWTLVNSTFTFDITWVYGYSTNIGLHVTGTGTFNSSNGTLTGTSLGVAPSGATNNATFSLVKVN